MGFFSNNKYNGKGTLYKDGKKIYEGNLLNGYYQGIGIEYLSNGNRKRKLIYIKGNIKNKCYGVLYDENNNEQYKGLLINGKPEKGKSLTLYDKNNYIIYKGDFSNFKFNGQGKLFFKQSNKILFNGIFKDDNYVNGILYYDDGIKQYEGEFLNNIYNGKGTLFSKERNNIIFSGIFKEGKYINGILFCDDGSKKYEGDFFNDTYNGKGILYIKGNNKKYYEGIFNNGKFKYGRIYDPKGDIIYEGEFKDNKPKEGKNIELYKLDGYLEYKGDFFNYKYHGKGKFYLNFNVLSYEGDFKYGLREGNGILYGKNNERYEGEFKNDNIHGLGRLYEDDDNYQSYLYYEGNFIKNEIYGKGIKYYVNGLKKIEGIFESINSYEGKYYNPKGKEIYNGTIINEIPMRFSDIILYNDLGLKVYDGEIYYGGYKNEDKKKKKKIQLRFYFFQKDIVEKHV